MQKNKKKSGIDIDVKPETVTEETLAPVIETSKVEATEVETTKADVSKKTDTPKV